MCGSPAGIRTPVAGSKARRKSLYSPNEGFIGLISEEAMKMPQQTFPAIGHVFHSSGKQDYYRRLLQVQNPNQYYVITEEDINRLFLEFEAKGVTHSHKRSVEYIITMFLKEATKENHGRYIFTMKDLKEYLTLIRQSYSPSFYRKNITYLKKLFRIAGIDLAESLKAPTELNVDLTIVTVDDIKSLIQLVDSLHISNRFEDWKRDQFITAMLLMAVSGMRVSELERIPLKEIDIENRRIRLNTHQTKTRQARVVFFTSEVQELLEDYIRTHRPNVNLPLATIAQLQRPFRKKSPLRNQKLRPKHMRKFFAQEWDRRNGNATIKKMLMGHSIRYDINALHYSHHTVDELQDAYDKVFCDLRFLG
ncbi:hypothetical protein TERMP_01843 [Thermococcus barophilus MP]|uniref:Tyr recombinase domain-containing protein n=2 Tax=Thermococcus barophilus TaxID=55802 RepID=F0LKI4_THEBM|nr:hypothetical protein TERMP_01843 [Thermococcus barophilus MP]